MVKVRTRSFWPEFDHPGCDFECIAESSKANERIELCIQQSPVVGILFERFFRELESRERIGFHYLMIMRGGAVVLPLARHFRKISKLQR